MRRTIELLSVTLVLAGFELAAGTLSTTLNNFTRTLTTTVAADVPNLPPMRFIGGVGLIVMGMLGLTMMVWARHAATNISRGPVCSRCGGQTQRVKKKIHHRALGSMLGLELARRRCVKCDRSGLSLLQ